MSESVTEAITVWRLPDLPGIELHRGRAVFRPYPRHWHEEYHISLIEDGGGVLTYRGVDHHTPGHCLFIVHPGEVHANRAYESGCTYRNLYIDPPLIKQQFEKELPRAKHLPFFREPVIHEEGLIRLFLRLHQELESSSSRLERDSLLWNFFSEAIGRYGEDRLIVQRAGNERRSIEIAREYLTDNYAENISLSELAEVAGLSSFHLNRVFCNRFGMPPHAYQTQLRVIRAKTLLERGSELSFIAAATGFADQSHFTRHFKRFTGVTPGQYKSAKAQKKEG